MIEARIRKSFPGGKDSVPFRLDLDFSSAARTTVLFGPSGAGKTLTLDVIAGFVRPDEGRLLVDDVLLFDGAAGVNLSPQQRRCGYVFQNYALFPHMSLRENLSFAAERLPRLERTRRVTELIELFHLAEVAGRRPHELSGGQKQRCSIARALLASPRLLLLDEPARGLDPQLRVEFYAVLADVRSRFTTQILLVTHDLDEGCELGDEMLVLEAGRLVQRGAPLDLLRRPASPAVARLLGRGNVLDAEILALDPVRNTSRLRCLSGDSSFEILGRYLPGHLLGDRLTLYVLPDQLTALPRQGNELDTPRHLIRAAERPGVVRLLFEGSLTVDMSPARFAELKHNEDWVVRFPPESLTVLE
jgi:molybdate transport system ATP-binding protein